MLRRGIATLTLAAAALAATPALAKGPDRALVCGLGPCSTIHGERAVSSLFVWTSRGTMVPPPAPKTAPYYSVRLDGGGSDVRYTVLYVPSRHVIRIAQNRIPPYPDTVGAYWFPLSATDERPFRRAVDGLRPLATPRRWG